MSSCVHVRGTLQLCAASQNDIGYVMEWSWHYLLGEPWRDPEPEPTKLCPSNPDACRHHISHAGGDVANIVIVAVVFIVFVGVGIAAGGLMVIHAFNEHKWVPQRTRSSNVHSA
jgi:hypothetical protein